MRVARVLFWVAWARGTSQFHFKFLVGLGMLRLSGLFPVLAVGARHRLTATVKFCLYFISVEIRGWIDVRKKMNDDFMNFLFREMFSMVNFDCCLIIDL